MTDIEFLDSLEFRANIRKHPGSIIELTIDEQARLNGIRGKWETRLSWEIQKVVLLGCIEDARNNIAKAVAAKLTGYGT